MERHVPALTHLDKDQHHAKHALVTDSNRLNEMLAAAIELQKALPPKIKRVGKQQTRYQPVNYARKPRRTWVDDYAERRAAELAATSADHQPPPDPTPYGWSGPGRLTISVRNDISTLSDRRAF